ncbi:MULTISPECIES: flagellar export chaperone FliS [Paenibacillus]|uniref:Flagellar secretion chaperone FliS n=1 Tax=Paenibacillus timonensis TaxID=225915 RepID=A0ABW3S9L4_9BACL|nr:MULTISPECIES: flagellar export chaperone FliS [Paenibacillus]EES72678.1 flagellar protein FliS [Paenibacillus sp. oral taxon 786 str. D14]MCH1640506.1 flagellar export chaperone FliS [Paenibacillus timonensis]MDU2241225.1 flagellar export chaperone FliS [Paenibacillus sp.]
MASQNISAYQSYQKNKYETASPHRLILMLYNGAVQYAMRAQRAIQSGDVKETNQYIQKTQAILYELISSLNEKEGGELARNLKNLYLYIIDRLIQANIKKNPDYIEEIIGHLNELKSAWEQIGKEVSLG